MKILIGLIAVVLLVGVVSAAAPVAHFYGNITVPYVPPEGSYLYCSGGAYPEWDGSDEGAELQVCFDDARDDGYDGVLFPASDLVLINQVINIWEGLEVVGNSSTIKLKDSSAIAGTSQPMLKLKGSNYFHNVIVDGNWQNGNAPNTNGLQVWNDNNRVQYNNFSNVRSYSVTVYASSNDIISDNSFYNGYQYGVNTGGSDGASSWGYNVTVQNNTFQNFVEASIKIRGTDGGLINNNTITLTNEATWNRGISLYSLDEPNNDITISNNVVHGFTGGSWPHQCDCISSDDEDNTNILIDSNDTDNCTIAIDIWFNDGVISNNEDTGSLTCIDDHGTSNSVYDNVCG